MSADPDAEIADLAKEELAGLHEKRQTINDKLASALTPQDPNDGRDVIIEIRAAAGGDESSLFAGELNMIRAEFAAGLGWAAGIALACMAVIFAAVMAHGRHLLLGETAPPARPQATPRLVAVPLIAGLIACALLGVSTWPIQPLLHAAAQVVAV